MQDSLESEYKRKWDTVRGRLCGLIEGFDLDHTQERVIISEFKSLTYALQRDILTLIKEIKRT